METEERFNTKLASKIESVITDAKAINAGIEQPRSVLHMQKEARLTQERLTKKAPLKVSDEPIVESYESSTDALSAEDTADELSSVMAMLDALNDAGEMLESDAVDETEL